MGSVVALGFPAAGSLGLADAAGSEPSGTAVQIATPSSTVSISGEPPKVLQPAPPFAILNAAGGQFWSVSPGVIVSIYEPGLLSSVGASVTFNGISAPILYAGADQINAARPFALNGQMSTTEAVMSQGQSVSQTAVRVARVTPAILTASESGTTQAAVLNQDSTANSASNPAAVGSVVSFFAMGASVFTPALPDGVPVPVGSTSIPVGIVAVEVGGQEAMIQYAGPVPLRIPGV